MQKIIKPNEIVLRFKIDDSDRLTGFFSYRPIIFHIKHIPPNTIGAQLIFTSFRSLKMTTDFNVITSTISNFNQELVEQKILY